MAEMTDRFNSLYNEALNGDLPQETRIAKLEQHRAFAYCLDWTKANRQFLEMQITAIKEENDG